MSRRCGRRHTSLGEAPLRVLSISWGEGCRCHVRARYITYVSVGDTHIRNLDRSRAALAGFFSLALHFVRHNTVVVVLFLFSPLWASTSRLESEGREIVYPPTCGSSEEVECKLPHNTETLFFFQHVQPYPLRRDGGA